MPGFRRWGKSKFQKNPESSFKLLAAVLVITLYLIIKEFSHPTVHVARPPAIGAHIQFADWKNGADRADREKAEKVRNAMKYTFEKYRENAWGKDDILPVSGGHSSTRNGWGAFIVDAATTMALMGLWDELAQAVEHIVMIDFTRSDALVDPFETTIRYLGSMVSLVDLYDAGVIPENVITSEARDMILEQAVTLANCLGPAYDTPTGMPWPRVDLSKSKGVGDPPSVYKADPKKIKYDHPAVGPARAGSSILENRALTRLTGNPIYTKNSTLSWAPLVWSKWTPAFHGLVDAPIDIVTGAPVGRQRHWDAGHDSYYEYLVKMTLLAPQSDPYLDSYKTTFINATKSLRKYLGSRSAPPPPPGYAMQHLFIGRSNDDWYENRQSHLACFAPGTILLASKFYNLPEFRTYALALLEGCHHTYTSTPSKIGPESWSWIPKFGFEDPVYLPTTTREKAERKASGFWSADPGYKGRPEYVESLFYAYRITGETRFREWAWEAFEAIEKHCKAPYGYAQLSDVYRVNKAEWPSDGGGRWKDVQESFWAAETLKYLWLTFADVDVANLDRWVFTTEAHPLRMMR
ncbi:mannosyl-oligosaccharide alpha-1,2-mannosidase-like protein [Massarina eburnea CBS 473.64]|uniref:alpha-1,2-Mannosidase n=1 Tax=Massarina eburnea CBS 473.64 TaxID=1395130 RepID=A0A6A6RQV5_9PLEO|nr:mannosyl-oligosaccharide alpha-1,2-mannosidase-like protein [Massarina eburnea CBS 473.64]